MIDRDPLQLLSDPARTAQSSVIRDLLEHAKRPGVISLAGGIPDPDLFPVDEITDATARLLSTDRNTLQYGLTGGETRTRRAVAPLLGREPDPECVVVTTGSQQALDLLAKVLVDPGQAIVAGDPSYLGALQAFRANRADLVALPVDEAGLVVDALAERLTGDQRIRPAFVYVVANFQNPTGAVLSESRRSRLVELAEAHGFLIVEDDPYGQLRYDGVAVSPIGEGSDHVVRLRSTSKVLAPGLRVGWLEGPRWLVDAVVIAKQSADLHTSTLSQGIVAELLGDTGWFDRHVEVIRAQYRARRDALCAAIDATFSDAAVYRRPEGGMFVWARFPGVGTGPRLTRALDEGVAYVPADAFTIDEARPETARLSFATVDPEDFAAAMSRLAVAFEA
ncbi:MAG: PLP-dependent aminotransferase family protein [Actinomycetota bacterium]